MSAATPTRFAMAQPEKEKYVFDNTSGKFLRVNEPYQTYPPKRPPPAFVSSLAARVWIIAALLAATLFAVYVWPTRYDYHSVRYGSYDFLVRIDRLTGQPEYLGPVSGTWSSKPHR